MNNFNKFYVNINPMIRHDSTVLKSMESDFWFPFIDKWKPCSYVSLESQQSIHKKVSIQGRCINQYNNTLKRKLSNLMGWKHSSANRLPVNIHPEMLLEECTGWKAICPHLISLTADMWQVRNQIKWTMTASQVKTSGN